jgi:hypothetical protein
MRFEEESRLKQLARENFPPYFAEIIEASQNTFVQAIYTAVVTHYRQGRYCLAGDAGARLVYSRFRAHGRAGDADWVAGRCENARRPVPIERQVNGRGSILSAGSTRC